MSDTYKIHVPKKVEEKIRYLCRKFPTLEWSGVLFTKHSGSFEDKNLEIYCEDFYPMDLGTSTYTDFNMSEDVVAYMAENIELFECDLGLVHSHNSFSAFFSGTDTSTLQKEGNDTNCFVSLIVNNAGVYCAAVTRKVSYEETLEVRRRGSSYEFFGEGTVPIESDYLPYEARTTNKTVIQYFMLDVNVEKVDNPLGYLDTRFEEIESKKKAIPKSPIFTTTNSMSKLDDDSEFFDWLHSNRSNGAKTEKYSEPSLFDAKTMKDLEVDKDWNPDEKQIKDAVIHMITCSLILNTEKFDLKQWIVRHMDNMYDKIFTDTTSPQGCSTLDRWIDFAIEYIIDTFEPTDCPEEIDYDQFASAIAMAMFNELAEYETYSKYISQYMNRLEEYFDYTISNVAS